MNKYFYLLIIIQFFFSCTTTSMDRQANTESGIEALHESIIDMNLDAVKALLDSGVSPDGSISGGLNPLVQTIYLEDKNKSVEIVKMLLEAGAEPDSIIKLNSQDGAETIEKTPLEIAASKQLFSVSKELILAGADLERVNIIDRCFLLFYGIAQDIPPYKAVQMLADSGAEVTSLVYQGTTALQIAVEKKSPDLVKIALESGADPNQMVKDGVNPIILVASYLGPVSIVDHLLEAGADPNIKGKDNYTALHLAVQQGNIEIVKRLIESGADKEAPLLNGVTPEILAQESDSKDMKEALGLIMSFNLSIPLKVTPKE